MACYGAMELSNRTDPCSDPQMNALLLTCAQTSLLQDQTVQRKEKMRGVGQHVIVIQSIRSQAFWNFIIKMLIIQVF